MIHDPKARQNYSFLSQMQYTKMDEWLKMG